MSNWMPKIILPWVRGFAGHSLHHVPELRQTLARGFVVLRRHVVHAGGVDPAVVKIKQPADGDGIEDGLIGPAGAPHLVRIGGGYFIRAVVHFFDEGQEHFLFRAQSRAAEILQHALDQVFAAQQLRRNCGVGADSIRAVVLLGCECGNQLANAGR